jgi:uncharacterized repeat protein (TIGR02543 family)
MTLYYDTIYQFPTVGNPDVYYVAKRTAIVYTYKRGGYTPVPIGAANHISPNYEGGPPPKPIFEIIFNDNGGTGGPGVISAEVGTWISTPTTVPTYTDYVFQGWADAATSGTAIVWPYKLMANVTFYAQWSEAPPG